MARGLFQEMASAWGLQECASKSWGQSIVTQY